MSDPRVNGTIRYAQDVDLPGAWHAAFVRSPHPHARVLSVDASELPADAVALIPDDVEDLGRYGCQLKDQTVLAATARFAGDIVAAVAAPTVALARAAVQAVEVDYEELPAVVDPLSAVAEGAPLVHPEAGASAHDAVSIGVRPLENTNVCHRFRLVQGDVEEGFACSAVVIGETFRVAGAQHVPMEPHASAARWLDDGRLELHTGTQTPFNLRADLAGMFGMDEKRIRVVAPPMGGSFGAKTFTRLEALVACLARRAGRPVKAVLDRAEEWVTLNRHPAVVRVRLGARLDGALVAKQLDCWVDTGAYSDCGPGVATKLGYAGVGPYRIPHVRVDSLAVYTNLPPNGAFRGYGATQSVWASERAMDLLAERLGMSPLELRRRNLLHDGDRFATGEVMHDVHFDECLQAAADAVDYERDPRGKGLCVLLKGMQTPSRAAIAVERGPVGYVIRSASCEMGQGVRESLRLMGAELLGCEPGQIEVPDPDTDSAPYDTRTTSSRSTHMMGRALVEAVADLERNGGERGYGEVVNDGGLDPDTGQGIASTHWHQGAAAAHVLVDEETGEVSVERLHAAVYAGRVVDRKGAELQNEGSMIMGLGTALFEQVDQADGQLTGTNLSDYNVPAIRDLPGRFTHQLIESEGAEAHGLGETALPPVPAAIGNALGSLGLGLTELPMTAERVLAAADALGPGSSE
ncbi:MAG TPA: xanthine dehydrogenase family protein molybdopterin-binding subunit [Thermoleophilaceae bacterium]|nr:xanthine dehydrogenase family protein molybdopterin-binding subunit [Thermoleophilaceae bacterium]